MTDDKVKITLANGDTMEVHPDTPVAANMGNGAPFQAEHLLKDEAVSTVYEPLREFWTPYEPWMRDVLADDARVSLLDEGEQRSTWANWASYGFTVDGWMAGRDARIHPDDVPVEGGYKRRAERERRYREEAEADLADMTRQRDALGRMADHNHDVAAKVKAERDEWKARHAALRADVEEMRREVCRGLWPDFRGVLARDTERGDVDPDAVTISLPRDDLTKPTVLRLAAADLRRKYHLGMGGLPRSLPGTLDALADGLEEGR